jgi:hypothetical protein
MNYTMRKWILILTLNKEAANLGEYPSIVKGVLADLRKKYET